MRQQVDADAQRPQLGDALEDRDVAAPGGVQAQRRDEPADAGADDHDSSWNSMSRVGVIHIVL